MAMFLFPHNGLVLLLIGYISVILQNGLITNSISVDATRGNIVIPANFLQIQKPSVTRLLISQPDVPHYLPCSASINYEPNEEILPIKDFTYVWFRNDIELKTFASRRNDFHIYPNGTLRLPTNKKAAGIYRCLVNATALGHHAMLSESCSVEYPVFERISSQSNITAIRGMPVTLNCPVKSIPTANVTWLYGNASIEERLKDSRFLALTNGSLVLKNVSDSDRGKYRCIAQNLYAVKKQRKHFLTLNVIPPKETKSLSVSSLKHKLLPPLQDEVHYIPSNTDLQLRCLGTSSAIKIEWWFRKTLDSQLEKITNNSAEYYIHEASIERDDGYYTCMTKTDSQIFQVIVTERPIIVQQLQSYESALAAFVNYSCSAVGNPSPEFSWYHNGKSLNENSYTTNIQQNVLTIQSFDLVNEGIYQCFARNIAGETYSASLLRLSHRENLEIMPKPLKNIRCYAMNLNTINVTFHSGTSPLYFISVHFAQQNPYVWESRPPLQLNHTEYVVISGPMPTYKPFVILTRALLPISSHRYSTKGSVEETMKSSILSEPAWCCTQGLPIRAFYLATDIFILWSNPVLKTKYFVVQFSIGFTRPHPKEFFKEPNLQGISSAVTVLLVPSDIEHNLQKVVPLTESQTRDVLSKVQSIRNDSNDYDSEEEIFSLVVPANVTGLLLKNCLRAKVRVLVVTNENEHLQQDFRYVQWKIIENNTEEVSTVPFRVHTVESRSIAFIFVDSFNEQCVQVCYFIYEVPDVGSSRRICQDMTLTSSQLVLRELKPKKHYKALFYSCTDHHVFGDVDVQTLPDPPGTITNQKVTKQDGLKLSWDPPKNPNGKINYYSILWMVNNTTHEANVSSSETFFKFPNVTEREKINVTVRVVGENGKGAPIYIDLRNIRHEHLEIEKNSILDTYWGIAIGVVLSLFCILIFSLMFVYQRRRFKLRSGQTQLTCQSESNIGAVSTPGTGGITETTGFGGFLGDGGGGLSGGLGESSTMNEHHEMQTLIPKSQHFAILKEISGATALKQLPNGNGNCPRRNDNSSECIFAETELNDEPIALCSSTPLPMQAPTKDDKDDKLYFIPVSTESNHRTDIAADYPASHSNRYALNKISSSPNFFNRGSSSGASGNCKSPPLGEYYNRQNRGNTHSHSQEQPSAFMRNGCFHYVNTANNRYSYSSSSNNSKVQLPSSSHPVYQLNHSIDNGVASLSEPRLSSVNDAESRAAPKNHELHCTDVPFLDRGEGDIKHPHSMSVKNNNNTLSYRNKQSFANDDDKNSSTAPLIENNSTIGFHTPSSSHTVNAGDHQNQPGSSGYSISLHHQPSSNPSNHHRNHEMADSFTNPLLKNTWSNRRPNIDPNG